MQDAGAVARPAHAGVGEAQHVAMARLQQRLRHRQHAPFRHAGAALRTGAAQHHDVVGRDVEIFIVDRRLHLRIAVEYQRRSLMLVEARIAGGRFDDSAGRREIALQNRKRPFMIDGIVERADDVVVVAPWRPPAFRRG